MRNKIIEIINQNKKIINELQKQIDVLNSLIGNETLKQVILPNKLKIIGKK